MSPLFIAIVAVYCFAWASMTCSAFKTSSLPGWLTGSATRRVEAGAATAAIGVGVGRFTAGVGLLLRSTAAAITLPTMITAPIAKKSFTFCIRFIGKPGLYRSRGAVPPMV
jgi:hypothetical protein